MTMWKLNPTELLQFRGDGQRFSNFVDRMIRAEAATAGLPQSEIRTQLRVHIPDGGVDTEVRAAFPRNRMGWFGVPTCWQFKAQAAKDIRESDLRDEIKKPYAKELIKSGYGYRLCLLGDLTPEKEKMEWEKWLNAEAKAINVSAQDVRVVHGGDLLPWAEYLPAIVLFLKPGHFEIRHLDAWQQTCHDLTPKYVPNPEWQVLHDQIRQHASFYQPCIGGEPCLTIGGAAGVGKTRLVFETLSELQEAPGLVVYAAEEQQALKAATVIANSGWEHAIIVADECTLKARQLLNDNICRGHTDRIRVFCLDNTGEISGSKASRIWLSADALKNTVDILRANYEHVPDDRRHQYSSLAKGFVRLAADMCEYDDQLKTGDLRGILESIGSYVRNRLQAHLPSISLLALFHKVGFRQDVESDINALVALTGITVQQFHDAVRQVRESPGFVVQAGRYWYVTPEIVSRVLFTEGWDRWVSRDPASFLQKLPEHLQQQLIERAGTLGDQEVRAQVAAFFRRWFDDLTVHDLQSSEVVTLLQSIVEAAPEQYLPRLRALLESADASDILQIRGEGRGSGWGPRRTLVWLLERLVSFPELFADCEACLFRLALYESEPQIGNNATRIWQGLYSVYLSGTATPFLDRAKIIRTRTLASNQEELQLAFSGLRQALTQSMGHVLGPDVVAGRLRPGDWQPDTYNDERACYREAIAICREHITGGRVAQHQLAVDALLNGTSFLLYHGLSGELADTLVTSRLSETEIRQLLKTIDEFIHVQAETGRATTNDKARSYIQTVRAWAESLRPSDFDGVLRSVLSRDPWDDRFSKDAGAESDEVGQLAAQILTTPDLLVPHLDWLASAEAASTERLGFALGTRDESFSCGRVIWKHAAAKGAAPLLRGYVRGFVSAERLPSAEMILLLDRLEASHPTIAVDILSYGGDVFDGVNRVVRLVEADLVPVRALSVFSMGVGQRGLNGLELQRLLSYFSSPNAFGDADTLKAGLRFLSTVLHRWTHWNIDGQALDDEGVRASAWFVVESSPPIVTGHLCYEWKHIVAELARYDASRACQLLGRTLLSENLDLGRRAEDLLEELASRNSDQVMEGLGTALLDPKEGWRLQVHVLHDLIAKISPHSINEWLKRHGLEGARKLARHLPVPFINEKGEPIVPVVLQNVLELYDDEKVFDHFLAGSHSGEMWWGNARERFRDEAENARMFLNHPNRWIRDWAKHETSSRLSMAEWEEREHAERFLPS